MTKEEAIKVIRHMAYLSAHVVENGVEAYEYIEQFLSKPSLPSNLDKAAEKYAWKKEEPLSDGERLSFCFNPRIDAFKAGAEWRDAQIPKLSNNLDEVAENRVTENGRFKITSFEKMRIEDIMFGAEWMAKQGETVEGYITDEIAYNGIAVILDNEEQFKPGDKVIVQIRKKEE